jgi:hypothetical protein
VTADGVRCIGTPAPWRKEGSPPSAPDTSKTYTNYLWQATNAIDGLTSHGYETGMEHVQAQDLKISLGSPASQSGAHRLANSGQSWQAQAPGLFSISQVAIDPAATLGHPADENLENFEIRVSTTGIDDASFSTVFTGTCQQMDQLQRFKLPKAVQARYVEIVLSSPGAAATPG